MSKKVKQPDNAVPFRIAGAVWHGDEDDPASPVNVAIEVESDGMCAHMATGVMVAVAASLQSGIDQGAELAEVDDEMQQEANDVYLSGVMSIAAVALSRRSSEEIEKLVARLSKVAEHIRTHGRPTNPKALQELVIDVGLGDGGTMAGGGNLLH